MWMTKALPILLIMLVGPPAWGQGEAAEKADSQSWVWYMIRPGDTIEGLTVRYLGSRDRWRENADLNSEVFPNPHVIEPGEHVRLLLPTELPADGALLREVSNRVEDQPTPLAWDEALRRELLRARDGVKTHAQSSAELEFADKTALLVTEQSIIFIGEEKTRQAQVDRTQIEIVVGQADLEGSTTASTEAGQFEIVLGDATATPRASEDNALQTRARRPESGGAQLMVYSGESDLEAAGAKVNVGTGMGSTVPDGEPPKPPEKLLPAPADLVPPAGSGLATPRPAFSWAVVEGADSYILEVCRDARCGALLERVVDLSESSWQPAGLPVEKLYWRVTAVSPSGLDGYPSESADFEILNEAEDTAPPEVRISFTGPRLAPRSGLNNRWIVGPGMTIEVEVEDGSSGVEEWTPAIDGEEIATEASPQRGASGTLEGPWHRGEHSVTVVASDRAGNRREVEVPFTFDPDPPELSWGVEGDGEVGNTASEPSDESARPAQSRRGRRELKIGKRYWQLDSDMAEILVRPQTGKPIGFGGRAGGAQTEGGGVIGRDNGLWVLAQDAVCSELDDLSYELVPGSKKGEYLLRIEAIDCVGNTRHGQLPLAKQKKR